MEENKENDEIPWISPETMTDSAKIDLLVDMLSKNSAMLEAMEKRLEILEHKSSQGVTEEAITKIVDENEGLKARMKFVTDVSEKNALNLKSSVDELRLQLNDLRKDTAMLTKSTVAQESFERNEEAKNVAVYNITEEQIRPFRNHTNSEEEALGDFVKKLAQQTVENLCEKDIKSIRKISSKSPKGCHSGLYYILPPPPVVPTTDCHLNFFVTTTCYHL